MELKLISGKTETRPWGASLCGIGITGIELRQQDFASLQHWPGEQVKEYLTQVIHPRFAAPSQPVPKGPVCWTGAPDESPAAVSGAEGEPVPLVSMRDEELRGVEVAELRERALFRLAALGVEIQSDGRLTDLPPAFEQLATMINELADRVQTADNNEVLQRAMDGPSQSHKELADVRNQVKQLKRNLAECRENVSRLKADRDHYRSKTAHLQEDLQEYRERVGGLTANLSSRSETDPVQPPPRFTETDRDTLIWVRRNGRALEGLVNQYTMAKDIARHNDKEDAARAQARGMRGARNHVRADGSCSGDGVNWAEGGTTAPHESAEHIRRLLRGMADTGVFGKRQRTIMGINADQHLKELESCAVKYYDL